MAKVCVVTVARGRHTHLRHQLRLLSQSDPDSEHVVVAIDDREIPDVVAAHRGDREVDVLAVDGHELGLPLAYARNAGVQQALDRGADLIVLLDVDCLVGSYTLKRYADAALGAGPALWCGPVTYLPEAIVPPGHSDGLEAMRDPHRARPAPDPGQLQPGGNHDLFWSLSAAFTPQTWSILGGFCTDYVGYGGEDTDLAWMARSRGIDLVWVGGADAYHQHHPISAPPIEHLDAIVRNAQVFHQRWDQWPMLGWLKAFAERGLVHFDGQELRQLSK